MVGGRYYPTEQYFKDPTVRTVFWKIMKSRLNDETALGFAVCAECHTVIESNGTHYHPDCSRSGNTIEDLQQVTKDASRRFETSKKLEWEIVTPAGAGSISVDLDDEVSPYFLSVKYDQSGSRDQLVVTFGEKLLSQSQKDKVQLFVDLKKREVRHDQSNKAPGELIDKLEVKFDEGSSIEQRYGDPSEDR